MSASLACLHFSRWDPRVELTTHVNLKAHNVSQRNFYNLTQRSKFCLQRIIKDRHRPRASASLAGSQPFSLAPRATYSADLLTHSIHTTQQWLRVKKDEVFTKTMYFRFLKANENVVMVCPLRKITPQTAASTAQKPSFTVNFPKWRLTEKFNITLTFSDIWKRMANSLFTLS